MLRHCGRQGERYDSINCRWWGCRVRCLRRSPWSIKGLSTRARTGCTHGCSKHWMWNPPAWKIAAGKVGLMDTGPASRLKFAGSRLYCTKTNWEACPAKSSAILFATLGKYRNRAWGRCRLTVVRMHSRGWCMSTLRRRPANWNHDEAGLSPNTQVFGCWMSCWRSFGAAEFLDSCLRGLIVLVACIWCRWLFVLDRCRWHTSWIWVGGLVPRKGIFCWYEHSYNFYPAPNVNLGIDREGTAKSQDGQQKGTLADVKRKLQRPFQWRWNLFKNIDIHVHLLQFQPSRLTSPRGCLEACFEACRQAHPERLFCSKFAWSRTGVATEDANAFFPSCRKRGVLR